MVAGRRRIIFVRDERTPCHSVYVMNADGKGVRRLTNPRREG
jgi:hypothetical protein